MLRSLFNLFLVGIICITATTIPIEKNGLHMNFSFKLPKLPTKPSSAKLVYVGESEQIDLENPNDFLFYIQSTAPQSLSLDSSNPLILEVSKDDMPIKTLESSAFVKEFPDNQSIIENQLTYGLDLSQQTIAVPDGTYVLKIQGTAKELSSVVPLTLNITYSTISPYIPATNTAAQGTMGLTLYFPDSEHVQYLIPITRFIKHTRAPLSATIQNLQKGSEALSVPSPIPEVKKLQVRGDTAIVHLDSNLGKYNENATDGYFAVQSFVSSLTTIPGIHQVKFMVNGQDKDIIFHDMSIKEPLMANKKPKVYLGLDHDKKRTLLVPVSLEDQTEIVDEIFNALKTGEIGGHKFSHLLAPIPKEIELIEHVVQGDTLTLNFSNDFLRVYSKRMDLQKMMLDAILYSYTSILEIRHIKILVDSQPVTNFAETDLSNPLTKPLYINPENI